MRNHLSAAVTRTVSFIFSPVFMDVDFARGGRLVDWVGTY